ncbi:MAG: hypothetical protein AB1426_06825 [Bacillota bacterium]
MRHSGPSFRFLVVATFASGFTFAERQHYQDGDKHQLPGKVQVDFRIRRGLRHQAQLLSYLVKLFYLKEAFSALFWSNIFYLAKIVLERKAVFEEDVAILFVCEYID